MNIRTLQTALFIVSLHALPAQADEADASQFAIQFTGSRTRAEVQAEAATVPRTRSTEPAGSRVTPPLRSPLTAEVVRAEAVRAARLGLTTRGEM